MPPPKAASEADAEAKEKNKGGRPQEHNWDAVKSYAMDKKAKKDEDYQNKLSELFTRSAADYQAQQQPSMAELTAGAPTTTETYQPGGLQGSFAGNVPPSHVTSETTAAPQLWALRGAVTGGVLGGISTGQDVTVSIALKPTSSIRLPRRTIDRQGRATTIETTGRHDPCVGIRATPIAEAMLACVLMDHALRHRAQCGDVTPPLQPGRKA
jgi:hypothetical protein